MAKVLAFVGAKGGTLKTASVAAVSHVIAKVGLRVVMIDGDPQADLTSRSGFSRVADPLSAEPMQVHYEGQPQMDLWLLRGGRSLEGAHVDTVQQLIGRAREMGADLVVIDTPPALGPITTTAISAAALVVIPAMPGKESLERAHDVVTLAKHAGETPIQILLTLANTQSNLFRWMAESVDEHYPGMRMSPVIPFEMSAGEAALFEVPVTVSAPRSRSAEAYCDVAVEVLRRLQIERRAAAVPAGAA